jgi:death on curing protein
MRSLASRPGDPTFLTVAQVVELHADRIAEHGGDPGIRDLGLLESAVMGAQQTFGGTLLAESIEDIAATYLFNINRNHPFIDGNKRAALAACDVFLLMNGCDLGLSEEEAVEATLAIADGRMTKAEVVSLLNSRVRDLRG